MSNEFFQEIGLQMQMQNGGYGPGNGNDPYGKSPEQKPTTNKSAKPVVVEPAPIPEQKIVPLSVPQVPEKTSDGFYKIARNCDVAFYVERANSADNTRIDDGPRIEIKENGVLTAVKLQESVGYLEEAKVEIQSGVNATIDFITNATFRSDGELDNPNAIPPKNRSTYQEVRLKEGGAANIINADDIDGVGFKKQDKVSFEMPEGAKLYMINPYDKQYHELVPPDVDKFTTYYAVMKGDVIISIAKVSKEHRHVPYLPGGELEVVGYCNGNPVKPEKYPLSNTERQTRIDVINKLDTWMKNVGKTDSRGGAIETKRNPFDIEGVNLEGVTLVEGYSSNKAAQHTVDSGGWTKET